MRMQRLQRSGKGPAIDSGAGAYPKFRFVVLAFLGLSNILNSLIMLSLGIMLPNISDDLGLSSSQQGFLGSSMFIGTMLMSMPAGLWLSKPDASRVLLGALAFGTTFVIVQAWAPNYTTLLLARLAFGVAIVARQPARAVLTAQWFPKREIVLVNGLVNTTYGASAVIALLLTPFLQVWLNDSWRWTLTIYGLIFMVVTLVWAIIGKERRTEAPVNVPGLRDGQGADEASPWGVLKDRDVWMVSMGMIGMLVMEFPLLTLWPTLMLHERGIEETVSGGMLLAAAISEGVGNIVLSTMFMSRGSRVMRRVAVAGLVTLLVGTAIGMTMSTSVPLLWTYSALHGVGFSFIGLIWTVPFEIPEITHRQIAVVSGFIEGVGRLGGVLGPAFVGIAWDVTGDRVWPMVISSFFGLTMAVAGLLLFRDRSGPDRK